MARLTDIFVKLALSLTEAVKYGRRDNNGDRGHQSGNSPQQHGLCFHCKQAGHKSVDCPQLRRAPPQPVNHYAPAGGYGQQYYAAPNRHQQQLYAGQGRYPAAGLHAKHGAANYLMKSAAPPTHADHMPVNYKAAMYAAQARQPPAVPFSPEKVSRRRPADARGTNRGSAINLNRRAPGVAPAGRGGNIGMPPIPARAERRTGAFDVAKELKSMKLSITCALLIKQSPGLRQDLLELVNDMDEEHRAHENMPPAKGAARAPGPAAPRIRSRPAAPVPFTFPNNSAPPPPPAGPVPFTFPNQAGPMQLRVHFLWRLTLTLRLLTTQAAEQTQNAKCIATASLTLSSWLQSCCVDTPLRAF